MKDTVSVREIIIWIAFLVSAYFAFQKKWDNSQLREDKIRSEEKIKNLVLNASNQSVVTDSIKFKAKSLEAIIEYQKNNPKIIIEKHDKIRDNVNVLNADESVRYLSVRLSKEGTDR